MSSGLAVQIITAPSINFSSGGNSLTIADNVSGPNAAPTTGIGTFTGQDANGSSNFVAADGYILNGWQFGSVSGSFSSGFNLLTYTINFQFLTGNGDLVITFGNTGVEGQRSWTTSMTTLNLPTGGTPSEAGIGYLNSNNLLLSTAGTALNAPTTLTTAPTGSGANTPSTWVSAGPYSVSLKATLHPVGSPGQLYQGQLSLTSSAPVSTAPDGGNTLMLIGSSLAGLSFLGRMRARGTKA